jgi:PAS domain S-box-containing protein
MDQTLSDLNFDHWEAILLSTLPALLNLFIFLYVRIKFQADKISKIFSLFVLALVLFQLSDTFVRMSNSVETAMLWNSIFMIGVLFLSSLGIHFTLLYTGKKKYADSFVVQFLIYTPAFIFFIFAYLNKEQFSFYPSSFWGWVYHDTDISLAAWQGYWIGMQGLIMLLLLTRHALNAPPKSATRKQAIIITTGFAIPLVQGICTEVILPVLHDGFSIPLTSAFMTFFSVAVLIALKKFGLFTVADSLQTETILEAMTDVLIILSPDKKILFINNEGEVALGVNNENREHLDIERFFAGGKAGADDFTEKMFVPALEGEKPESYSTEFISKTGRRIPVLISATPFKVAIGKPQVLLLVHDITTLIQTEQRLAIREDQLKDKTEELNSFFYRTTHDLKGPVASIIGLAKLAKKEQDLMLMAQCLEKIETSAARLNEILLDFIKVMQIKERVTEVTPVNFYKMTDNIIQAIRYSTDRDIVNFKVWIEPNTLFHSDENLLDSILYNLVANAVNYRKLHSDEDSFVHIQVRRFGNGVLMKVSDNGIGIRKEIQGKIFNLFFRGTEDSKGTGLGLYILKNALAKLNGRIEIESEINQGTTFTVYLPDLKAMMPPEEIAEVKLALPAAC